MYTNRWCFFRVLRFDALLYRTKLYGNTMRRFGRSNAPALSILFAFCYYWHIDNCEIHKTLIHGICSIIAAGILEKYFMRDDVIKWKHVPCNWPFVRGNPRSPVDSLHTGQWTGALMFSFLWARTNGWANNRDAGDLRRHRAHYHITAIVYILLNQVPIMGPS